ncbi:MAG: PAS domain S-box protein [Deltaproteobacteria bacterium]|nr:PAS domain S-box protein [Deltaproteobacteria bacterium]
MNDTTLMLPSISATITGSLLLSGIYYYISTQIGNSAFRFWSVSWIAFTLQFLLSYLHLSTDAVLFINFSNLSAFAGATLLYAGIMKITGTSLKKSHISVFSILFIWSFTGLSNLHPLLMFSIPIQIYSGVSVIITGVIFLFESSRTPVFSRKNGYLFIVIGVLSLSYPLTLVNRDFAFPTLTLSALLLLSAGVTQVFTFVNMKTREALLSENVLKAVIGSIKTPMAMMDLNGEFLAFNDKWMDMLGKSEEELSGHSFMDSVFPESQSFPGDFMDQLVDGDRTHIKLDQKILNQTGNAVYADMIISPVVNNGLVSAVIAIANDVTEHIRFEKKLEELNANLMGIIENTDMPICTIDEKFRLITSNTRFRKVILPVLSGNNENSSSILRSETKETSWFKDMIIRAHMGEQFTDIFHFSVDNKKYYFDVNFNPVILDNTVSFVSVVAHDISDMKILIEKLENAVKEKEHLSEQLFQSQKLESIGQLAGGIAHDFNNILTTIIGNAHMAIEQTSTNPEVSEYLEEINKSSQRASDLTRQLLAFSRKQIFDIAPFDLMVTINNLIKMISRLIGEDIELVIRPCNKNTVVKGDRSQIEQVLINLSVNARDAMPYGGKLTIEVVPFINEKPFDFSQFTLPHGDWIELKITDTGQGIPRGLVSRVFEPFFTTKPKDKGTGLGLSMVYGIVKQHNGFIDLDSMQGKGTVFRIFLPHCEESTKNQESGSWDHIQLDKFKAGRKRILLVEDEDLVRKVAVKSLVKKGFEVIEASNGVDALEKIEQLSLDIQLVITDLIMPQMGGVELAQCITHIRPDIHILFTSGYIETSLVPQLQPGKSDFLQKPYTPKKLLQKVSTLISDKTDIN